MGKTRPLKMLLTRYLRTARTSCINVPFRENKNRAKIYQLNMTIEDICDETSAAYEFEDLTITLMNADTGKINKNMYLWTIRRI